MTNRDVFLVRHAERMDFNDDLLWDPRWPERAVKLGLEPNDAPLTDRGLQQAEETAEFITAEIKEVFTSPFLRCLQTAKAISERHNCKLTKSADLTEWMNPEWFGGEEYNFFRENHISPNPGIFLADLPIIPEYWPDAEKRMLLVLSCLGKKGSDFFPVCLVTHGWFIHHMLEAVNPGSMHGQSVEYANLYRISV